MIPTPVREEPTVPSPVGVVSTIEPPAEATPVTTASQVLALRAPGSYPHPVRSPAARAPTHGPMVVVRHSAMSPAVIRDMIRQPPPLRPLQPVRLIAPAPAAQGEGVAQEGADGDRGGAQRPALRRLARVDYNLGRKKRS